MEATALEQPTPLEQIISVENWIKEQPQVEIETRHYQAGDVYEREILVPAGSLITGKVHLTEHLAKLVSGEMIIYSENKQGTFIGPCTFISKPGEKRIGFAKTDCFFSTFHHIANEVTVEEAEKMLVVDTVEEYQLALAHQEQLKLEGNKNEFYSIWNSFRNRISSRVGRRHNGGNRVRVAD